jgi:DNA (cytosine-5)-methyltransferase 1
MLNRQVAEVARTGLKGKDMFCGLGGFTLAMERVGIDCTLAVNHWDKAIRVHAANHLGTEHMQRNLLGFKFGELDPFDILTAGVACQPHSDAGHIGRAASRKVFDNHAQMRATAWAVWKCAQVCRPKYLIVENVRGFIRWKDLQRWLAALRKLGYAVTQQFLCASRFGLPQRRWRWFFIAVLGGPPVQMVNPNVPEPGVGTIFDASAPGWIDIDDLSDFKSAKAIEKGYLSPREKARYANARLNGELGIGQHTNYGYWGIRASEPVNTVTGQAGQLWWTRDGQYRLWTRNECKRAQGIPDSYDLLDTTEREAAKLIGNAVPIDLAMAAIRAATGRGDPSHLASASPN